MLQSAHLVRGCKARAGRWGTESICHTVSPRHVYPSAFIHKEKGPRQQITSRKEPSSVPLIADPERIWGHRVTINDSLLHL